jgi:hypothetical protein
MTIAPTLFDDLFVPPIGSVFADDTARARRSDPLTSHEAADRSRASVQDSKAIVLQLLTDRGPMAQFQIVAALAHRFSESRLRTAVSELKADGLVEWSGKGILTPLGNPAQVWQITKGRAA